MPDKENSFPVENLESLLRQRFVDDFTIENVDWKNLTDPGENYGSLIIAVTAKIRRNSKIECHNMVIKLPPPSSWLQELFNTPFTFFKELTFYRDITPLLIELQRENGVKEPEKDWLGADYYGGRIGTSDNERFDDQAAIVLENLNYSGYATMDRLVGLGLNQAEMAVRKLAKFHAIPIVCRTKKPKIFDDTILPLLGSAANENAKDCLVDMMKKSINDLNDITECRPFLASVEKTMNHIAVMDESLKNSKKNQWSTIVHNDFWVNNMMFRNDEAGNAIDMKIVDFQLYVYDYGVKDLIFFLISSLTIDVIETHFDRLIETYYDYFVNYLDTMGIDIANFTKQRFDEIFNECATLKFAQCIMMNQVIKAKHGAAPRMEDIKSKENFLTIGGGEIYQRKMLHTVEFFHKRGWLVK